MKWNSNKWALCVCLLSYLRVVKTHKLVLRLVLMDGALQHSIGGRSGIRPGSYVVTLSGPDWNTGHVLVTQWIWWINGLVSQLFHAFKLVGVTWSAFWWKVTLRPKTWVRRSRSEANSFHPFSRTRATCRMEADAKWRPSSSRPASDSSRFTVTYMS